MLLKFLSLLSSSLFSCSNIVTFPFFMPFTSLNTFSVHFICHKKSLLKFNSPYTLCQHLSSCTLNVEKPQILPTGLLKLMTIVLKCPNFCSAVQRSVPTWFSVFSLLFSPQTSNSITFS